MVIRTERALGCYFLKQELSTECHAACLPPAYRSAVAVDWKRRHGASVVTPQVGRRGPR